MLVSSFYPIDLPSLSHVEEAPVSNASFFFARKVQGSFVGW